MLLRILIACGSLAAGLAVLAFATQARTPARRSFLVVAWLLFGLFPVFFVFSFFPGSEVSGQVAGFAVTGAFAAFVLIWVYGTRHSTRIADSAQQQADLTAARLENERLQRQVDAGSAQSVSPVIVDQKIIRYRLHGAKERQLGVVTGNLIDVRFVDFWVNSENTNMQMSRFYEASVSAAIRYFGAVRDEKGRIVEDVIADELAAQMGDCVVVEPATVFVTSSGSLAATHGVKAILHVASVTGQPRAGYQRVADIGGCMSSALDAAEKCAAAHDARSIIFPLLGTGGAGADLESTASTMIAAAHTWLASPAARRLTTVYFLAYREHELAVCRQILGARRDLQAPAERHA